MRKQVTRFPLGTIVDVPPYGIVRIVDSWIETDDTGTSEFAYTGTQLDANPRVVSEDTFVCFSEREIDSEVVDGGAR